MHKFMIGTIEETVTEESASHGDVASSEMSEFRPATFREALERLNDDCWDNVDWREKELIAYPAESHQNFRTGDWESTTLVIRAGRPEWLARLARAYDSR